MKKFRYIIATLFVVAIGAGIFWACQKEDVDNTQIKQKSFNANGLMYFSNFDEFLNTIDELYAMDFDELCAYENTNGYTSFGRESEEVYYNSLEVDSLSTDEEIQSFVNAHSDFVQIYTDYDGEQLYVPILFDHPFRYIINNNRMFQIGDIIYKVFNSGIASILNSSTNSYEMLLNLSESDLEFIDSNSMIQYIPKQDPYIMFEKDAAHDMGNNVYISKVDGNERVRLFLGGERLDGGACPFYPYYGWADLRGFRKIGNNWCGGKRTLGCNVWCTLDYWDEKFNPNNGTCYDGQYINNNLRHLNFTVSSPKYYVDIRLFGLQLVNGGGYSDRYMLHYSSAHGTIHTPPVWYTFNLQ